MKNLKTIFFLVLQLYCYNFLLAQQRIPTNKDIKITIKPTESSDGRLTVIGKVENLTTDSFNLKYILSIVQRKNTYTRNRNRNRFTLTPNAKGKFGKVVVPFNPKEVYDIKYEIFHDTTLISYLEISNELEKTVQGTGLIIDASRTKNGRDFYELFVKHWRAADQETDSIIKIEEKPGRSRTTQILVFINNEMVLSRMLSTRYQQIEEQSEWAFNVTLDFLKRNPHLNGQSDEEDLLGNGLN